MTSGVGFTMTDGQTGYFWTWREQEAVITALLELEVLITNAQRATGTWRQGSGPGSVASLPTLSRVDATADVA